MLAMSSVMTKLESAVFANEEVKRRTPLQLERRQGQRRRGASRKS
jgi:hypothetical protein